MNNSADNLIKNSMRVDDATRQITEISPSECQSINDIRKQIDLIDDKLLELLAFRFGYVERVCDFKQNTSQARDLDRINEIVKKIRGKAEQTALPPNIAEAVWRHLIEQLIEFEQNKIATRTTNSI